MSAWRVALLKWIVGCDSYVLFTKTSGTPWRFSSSILNTDPDTERIREELAASIAATLLKPVPPGPLGRDIVSEHTAACWAMPICGTCGRQKKPIGRDAAVDTSYCDRDCAGYRDDPQPGHFWPGEPDPDAAPAGGATAP